MIDHELLFSHVCFSTPPKPPGSHILTHSANLDFGPKLGFKNKYQVRAGFELQNEAGYNSAL